MPVDFAPRRPGSAPGATDAQDAAYIGFIAGMRAFQLATMRGAVRQLAPSLVQEWEAQTGRAATTPEDAHAIFDRHPVFQWRHFLERILQERQWAAVGDSYRRRAAELLAELDRADQLGPGSVRWDPGFPTPEYIKQVSFHLQPGGYYDDPLLGHVYHGGTDLYLGGSNDVHARYVAEVPIPDDRQLERVLDLGCAIGQSAVALKQRFPEAEVWGIDVSAPMVRYAHKRAVDLGMELHFAQMSADALDFSANHFDLVHAYLLFHETPLSVTRGAVREAFRVLRPGGLFVINDIGPNSPLSPSTPLGAWMLDYAIEDNEDPFARDYVLFDIDGELTQAGFTVTQKHNTAEIGLGSKGLIVGRK